MIHTTITSIQAVHHDISLMPFTFFLNQLAIFAVPLFFLISGFVLELNYQKLDYGTYFRKRASRIVIPYIFWSLLYYLAYPETISKNTSFFSLLLSGKAAYQFYFIPSIILLYLLFPLLHKFYFVFARKSVMLPLFFLEIVLQIMDYFYGPFSIGNTLRVTLLSFVMFPLGMMASHHEEKISSFSRTYFRQILALLVLIVIGIMAQGWYYYQFTKNLQAIYSQYNAFVLPYTVLIAAIFFLICSQTNRYKGFIMQLSKLSFFVFFIHVALIYTFSENFKPFIYSPLLFFAFITSMSFLIADLVHRIPKLSKITG